MYRAALLAAFTGCAAFASIGPSAPQAVVAGGALRGISSPPGAVFKGIPFAAPPVGRLRWREPQPVAPWSGVRDATRYAAACEQNPIGTGSFIAPLARDYGAVYPTPRWNLSEDCLYLNIWTPEWPVKQSHAVMFWIHGGSNRIGSGGEPAYDGASLASHGVVVVTINYRLGVFGFFSHPELTRESPHHASGNYGLMDQAAALEWVHHNIAAFGGDPARVTVFGESAGGIDTGMLMCSPLARGLFQRAIVESGPVFLTYPAKLPEAERYGTRVAALARAATIEKLRAVPPQTLIAYAIKAARQVPRPDLVLDGWALPESPQEVFARGKEHPAALIIGNNGREASAFRGTAQGAGGAALDAVKKTLRLSFGSMAPVAMAAYVVDTKMGRTAAADSWINDGLVTCPSLEMAALHAAAGHPTYVYQFRRSVPGKGESNLGSFHSLELPYVFGALHSPGWSWLPFQAVDEKLAAGMERYWTNFAIQGDPNGPGLAEWPRFQGKSGEYLEFGNDGQARAKRDVQPVFCGTDLAKLRTRLLESQ